MEKLVKLQFTSHNSYPFSLLGFRTFLIYITRVNIVRCQFQLYIDRYSLITSLTTKLILSFEIVFDYL